MKDAILTIITAPPGFGIDLFGGELLLARLEDGQYSVTTPKTEELFADPLAAIDVFLARREELQLGYDYENPPAT